MTTTPNKGYDLQTTGSNNGTWGVDLNTSLTTIDTNFGGKLSKNCAGSSNVTLNSTEAANFYHNLTGVLTGNIKYIVPNTGSFYSISNNTTGSYTLTVVSDASGSGVTVSQGSTAFVYVDSANTAVVNAVTFSSSGTTTVANGGTGATSLTAHGVVVGNGTSAVNVTSAGTTGQILTSNGASADPTFQTLAATVAQGGTGQTSLTANNVIIGNGTGAVSFVAPSTSGNVLTSNGTTWTSATPSSSGGITLATQQNASGTTVPFTGISSAKQINIMLNEVSGNGTSDFLIQIGSGSYTTSGYISTGSVTGSGGTGIASSTAGFLINVQNASGKITGCLTLTLMNSSTNTWVASGDLGDNTNSVFQTTSGRVSLSGTLDRLRFNTVNGTDSYDSGTVNISYQ